MQRPRTAQAQMSKLSELPIVGDRHTARARRPPRPREGLVGSIVGGSYLVTSVIGGLSIGFAGMVYVVLCTALAIVHLAYIRLSEPAIAAPGPNPLRTMLGCTIALWSTVAAFTIHSSICCSRPGHSSTCCWCCSSRPPSR